MKVVQTSKGPKEVPSLGVAVITAVRPMGFVRQELQGNSRTNWEPTVRNCHKYLVTYQYREKLYSLDVINRPGLGIAKVLSDAVKDDVGYRMFNADPVDNITLPLEVEL